MQMESKKKNAILVMRLSEIETPYSFTRGRGTRDNELNMQGMRSENFEIRTCAISRKSQIMEERQFILWQFKFGFEPVRLSVYGSIHAQMQIPKSLL